MASTPHPSHEPETEHTGFLSPRLVRMLVVAIIVMTILIIAGVIAVFIGIKSKLESRQMDPPVRLEAALELKPGERLSAYKLSDDGVWVEFTTLSGSTRLVHITQSGFVSHQLMAEPAAQ